MDAIALLKNDHRTVRASSALREDQRQGRQGEDRETGLPGAHGATIEESFLSRRQGVVDDDLYDEALVEHDAKVLIAEILEGSAGNDFYD
jgi:hypothetical protein